MGRAGRARRGRPPSPGVAAAGAGTARGEQGGAMSGSGRRQPPDTLRARLRPYQLDGFGWLAFLWQHRLGGILADDMGLGKTLEALALICHARRTRRLAVPRRRTDQRRAELGGRVRPVRSRPEGGDDHRHAGPQQRRPGRGHRGRRHRGHLVHAAAPGLRRPPGGGGMVRPDPGRPSRTTSRRSTSAHGGCEPVQGRNHRHPDGEQPDGAVVAAVDHGTGTVPQPGTLPRLLRPADRTAGRRRCSPSCGAGSGRL